MCASQLAVGGRVAGHQEAVLLMSDPVQWMADDEAIACAICSVRFSYNLLHPQRRHHCRLCGALVCAACSESRVAMGLPATWKLERACRSCATAAPRLHALCGFLEELQVRLEAMQDGAPQQVSLGPEPPDGDSAEPGSSAAGAGGPSSASAPSCERRLHGEDIRALIERLTSTTDDLQRAWDEVRHREATAAAVSQCRSLGTPPAHRALERPPPAATDRRGSRRRWHCHRERVPGSLGLSGGCTLM